ncbi:MAG: RluA family pseudouridine synthase [Planctomycetia bacterium]|nr:RluA family pseudouridine synthase [Planctomycetia bacterium]
MQKYSIDRNSYGKRLDRFVFETNPLVPHSYVQKAIRKKKIRVNKRKTQANYRLQEGDLVQIAFLQSFTPKPDHRTTPRGFTILYEDENILLADKEAGILCVDTDVNNQNTLQRQITQYLSSRGDSDSVYLCNRIDCNTTGIVILAKNQESKELLDEKIRQREIVKSYLGIVYGTVRPSIGYMENYLFKDARKNKVYLSNTRIPGSKIAVAEYRTLETDQNLSLLECQLFTGRTHQIRSQLAYAGYPLLGDDKYGNKKINRIYKERKQLLCSYKIEFAFQSEEHRLGYLNKKVCQVQEIDFCNRYFPKAKIVMNDEMTPKELLI